VQPATGFVSLGCPKAVVDSERMLTGLRGEGDRIAGHGAHADLVMVNICDFCGPGQPIGVVCERPVLSPTGGCYRPPLKPWKALPNGSVVGNRTLAVDNRDRRPQYFTLAPLTH